MNDCQVKVILDKEQVNKAIECMQKAIKCNHNAPLLNDEIRNVHIKDCQETAIKCYLDILFNIK